MSDAARAAGYDVILTNTDEDPDVERSSVKVLLSRRVDGIVVAPTTLETDHLSRAVEAGCPVVLLDRRLESFRADTVLVDNVTAARDVVGRLLAVGHRRIAMVTGGTSSDEPVTKGSASPPAGTASTATSPPSPRPAWPSRRRTCAAGRTTRSWPAGSWPTCSTCPSRRPPVFASDSRIALGVLRAIREAGRNIPADISMVSFDDADWTSVVNPAISVVAQPTYALGRRAAERLLARIAGDEAPPALHMMSTDFLARGSVAPPADRP